MSSGNYPLADALAAFDLLVANLCGTYERLELAGSARRLLSEYGSRDAAPASATVGDLEIVAVPRIDEREHPADLFGAVTVEAVNLMWERLDSLQPAALGEHENAPLAPWWSQDKNGRWTRRWGDRYRKLAAPTPGDGALIPCDLFLTTWLSWGAQFAIRTGPWRFSKALMSVGKPAVTFSEGVVSVRGRDVDVLEELDVFDLLGLPWLEPHERTMTSVKELVALKQVAA